MKVFFCRISSLLQGSFAKEIYDFKESTSHSHPYKYIPHKIVTWRMPESWHIWVSHVSYEWVMSHTRVSCLMWMCRGTYEWVMSAMNETGFIPMWHVSHIGIVLCTDYARARERERETERERERERERSRMCMCVYMEREREKERRVRKWVRVCVRERTKERERARESERAREREREREEREKPHVPVCVQGYVIKCSAFLMWLKALLLEYRPILTCLLRKGIFSKKNQPDTDMQFVRSHTLSYVHHAYILTPYMYILTPYHMYIICTFSNPIVVCVKFRKGIFSKMKQPDMGMQITSGRERE